LKHEGGDEEIEGGYFPNELKKAQQKEHGIEMQDIGAGPKPATYTPKSGKVAQEEPRNLIQGYFMVLKKYNRIISIFFVKNVFLPRSLKPAYLNFQLLFMLVYMQINVMETEGDLNMLTAILLNGFVCRVMSVFVWGFSQRDGHLQTCKNSCVLITIVIFITLLHFAYIGFCLESNYEEYQNFHEIAPVIIAMEFFFWDFVAMPILVILSSKIHPRIN